LPYGVNRLEHLRADYEPIKDRTIINYEYPFWVSNYEPLDDDYAQGHLFRHMYHLRVGSGCHGKCKYCTIRITRGEAYILDSQKLEKEFSECKHNKICIVGDTINPDQIVAYSHFARKYRKRICFRNVEPQNAIATKDILTYLAKDDLLDVLHIPIQAVDEKTLRKMGRSKKYVDEVLSLIQELQKTSVFTATNIIIDYDDCENNFDKVYKLFDYVSWNPYWDGNFDLEKDKKRMAYYITGTVNNKEW